MNSASPATTPTSELLHFLEFSIGEKTDAYLRQLALLAAQGPNMAETCEDSQAHPEKQNQTTPIPATTELKNQYPDFEAARRPITGFVTAPKSIWHLTQLKVGVKFMLQLHAISGPQCPQTELMARLRISKLKPDTVLFWNWMNDNNGTFILSFFDIKTAFGRESSLLYPQQGFIAEVLSVESSTIQLRLVENLAVN